MGGWVCRLPTLEELRHAHAMLLVCMWVASPKLVVHVLVLLQTVAMYGRVGAVI